MTSSIILKIWFGLFFEDEIIPNFGMCARVEPLLCIEHSYKEIKNEGIKNKVKLIN